MEQAVPDSVPFPAVDKCLNGESLIISWKTAFIGLSAGRSHKTWYKDQDPPVLDQYLDSETDRSSLERFLTDQASTNALARPFSAPPAPTARSKAAFETRTAAINITPASHSNYDIDQIKEDALWLSKASNINEVAAFRIVLLEWQLRPAAQLLSGFSEEEAASVQDAAGGSALGSSLLQNASILSISPGKPDDASSFNSTDERMLRLLKLYLSERRYILKVSEYLIRAGLFYETTLDLKEWGWAGPLGRTILNSRILGGEAGKSGKTFLVECIEALQDRVVALERGSGLYKEEGGRLEVEADWGKNQVLEMIHIMQIMFLVLDANSDITPSSTVLAWLGFMSKYAFFDRFEPPYLSQQSLVYPLQSLTSVVSLHILKLPYVLDHLLGDSGRSAPGSGSPDTAPYIINHSAINGVNNHLMDAAGACLVTASPAVFAWCIILQTMRELVRSRNEARELQQSHRAVSSFSEAESTGTEEGDSSTTEPGSEMPTSRPPPTGRYSSPEPSMYEEVLKELMDSSGVPEGDAIAYLAKSAVNGSHVFEVVQNLATTFCTPYSSDVEGRDDLRMRLSLLHLVRAGLGWVEYQPEVVSATLAVLEGGEGYWDFVDHQKLSTQTTESPISFFLADQLLLEKLLEAAMHRFPYESAPFLKLYRALARCLEVNSEGIPRLVPMLEHVSSFTQALPPGFRFYELAHEEDGRNMVRLTSSLEHFGPRKGSQEMLDQVNESRQALVLANKDDGSFIPKGTLGMIISESKPWIATWNCQYSVLKYIGKVLESTLIGSGVVEYATNSEIDRDTIADMVGLLTILLTSCTNLTGSDDSASSTAHAAQGILEEASDGVGRNKDIIAIVFDIFEEELQEQQLHPGVDRSMSLLVSCAQFIYSIIPVLPGRVWAFLARSGLLEIEGRGGKLGAIVSGAETVTGRYELLLCSVRIFEALVEDAVRNAIARKQGSRATTRFNSPPATATGVSEKAMKQILLSFTRTVVDVFESSPNWKFVLLSERLEIGTRIVSVMDKILHYIYSIDDIKPLECKVTGVLAPSAEFLVEAFLSASTTDTAVRPILQTYYEGVGTPDSTLFLCSLHSWTTHIQAVLGFSTTLIRIGRLLQFPTSHLEKQLFKASPLLARLYAAHENFRVAVLSLFESLVVSAAASEQEPPSLLGHLGPETAKNFLSMLSNLDKPVENEKLDIQIWNFLSAVVSNRQQWLAIYLLTGNTPRNSLAKTGGIQASGSPRGEPLLTVALNSLVKIDSMAPQRALAILEFVTLAEDYWPWAMADMHKHPKLMKSIYTFVGSLNTQKATVESANKIRMASYIAEVLAMYLHRLRQLGDTSFAKDLIPNIGYYLTNAVVAPKYNLSLHSNLRKNFEMKFPSCNLLSFKRTQLERRSFGRGYFYDIDPASKMLHFEPSWAGVRGSGFLHEVAQANINLSVVEAQNLLLHGWKFLLIELSASLPKDSCLQKHMAKVANDCLRANAVADLPEHIFSRLTRVRADFAFVLMQRLVEAHSTEPDVRAILGTVWETIKTCGTNFQLALSAGDASYYRSLLKILYLALKSHVEHTPSDDPKKSTSTDAKKATDAEPNPQVILEILELIVARGFHDLVSAVHERPAESSPEDIALVTATLQTCLRLPRIEAIHLLFCQLIAAQNAARVATTLFSWSDRLAIDGDPVYGELSILFLLELSSVPLIAEQLATDGILTQLANANIMSHLRRGVSPFDSPARLHAIWARGILALLLNLLQALGPAIAIETALFLNQFHAQLSAAVANWDNDSGGTSRRTVASNGITLSMASEAHSLALIVCILDQCGKENAAVAGNVPSLRLDRARLVEGMEVFLSHRRILAAKVIPMTPADVEMAETQSGMPGTGSLLEAKIVQEMTEARQLLLTNGVEG